MKRLLAAVSLGALSACASLNTGPQPTAMDQRFTAIYEAEWAWRNSAGPTEGDESAQEDENPKTWARVDPAWQAERLAYLTGVMTRLDALNPAAMSPAERVNLSIYRYQIGVVISRIKFRDYEKPLNADSTFWTNAASSAPKAFRTTEEAEHWVARLNDLPRYFDDQVANMKLGAARGFTPPRATLEGRDKSITAVYENKTPEQSSFYEPFKTLPASIPADKQAELRAAASKAIADKVFPAYKKLLGYYRDEYYPLTTTNLAATSLPDGAAYYQAQIHEFTTLDKTPDEIHQIGLAEVAKIRARMEEQMKLSGFKGTFPDFLKFLRTDPQFYPKTGEELLMRGAWISKKFDGKAERYFGRLPRSRFDVIPVPDDIAPFYTAAAARASTCSIPTTCPRARSIHCRR